MRGRRLQVEIFSADGTPMTGYRLDDSDTNRGNSLAKQVTWQGNSEFVELADKPVRLRLVTRSMKLFTFQFAASLIEQDR